MEAPFASLIVYLVLLADHQGVKAAIVLMKWRRIPFEKLSATRALA
jgi:hypothetical protein